MEWPVICVLQLLVNRFTILEIEKYNSEDNKLLNTSICLLFVNSMAFTR